MARATRPWPSARSPSAGPGKRCSPSSATFPTWPASWRTSSGSTCSTPGVRTGWSRRPPAIRWDSELTEQDDGRLLAWRTTEDAEVKNLGRVEFRDAPGGRGTEVHATLVYEPPAGALGKVVAALFQKEPGQQAKRDLRRLKMLLETGEIATTEYEAGAAPRFKKADASDEAKAAETR
nr:SRPBCC family protein [Caulobacter sp. S45]